MWEIRPVVTGVGCCSVSLAGVGLKRGDLSKAVLRDSSSGRSSFVFLWVADTEEAKTGCGLWVKSQLKESKRSQASHSWRNICVEETSHG